MFTDLLNFSKKRTLKESIGFFIIHGSIALSVVTLLELLA